MILRQKTVRWIRCILVLKYLVLVIRVDDGFASLTQGRGGLCENGLDERTDIERHVGGKANTTYREPRRNDGIYV